MDILHVKASFLIKSTALQALKAKPKSSRVDRPKVSVELIKKVLILKLKSRKLLACFSPNSF